MKKEEINHQGETTMSRKIVDIDPEKLRLIKDIVYGEVERLGVSIDDVCYTITRELLIFTQNGGDEQQSSSNTFYKSSKM